MNDEDKDNIKILDIEKEKQNDENQSVNDSDSSDIKISETLTENQPDSEFKSEEDKEHEVIHKKEGRLHIYIRQDKYKGELKSKNWVGRLYIDGTQKILSSGTPNFDEAIPILEKWFDDVFLGNENNEEANEEIVEIAKNTPNTQSEPQSETNVEISEQTQPVIVSEDIINPIENTKSKWLKTITDLFQKLKNIKLKKTNVINQDLTTKVQAPNVNDFKNKIETFFNEKLGKKINQGEDVIGLEITNEEIIIFQIDNIKNSTPILKKAIFHPTELAIQEDYLANVFEISEKIKDIYEKEKIKTKNVVISISSINNIIRTISIPLMTDKELSNSAKNKLFWKNYIQTSDNLEEFSINYQVLSKNENTIEVLLVGVKLSDIAIYQSILDQAELNLVSIQIKCFSIYNSLQISKQNISSTAVQPLAILEFGTGENYLIIIHDNKPFITDIFLREADQQSLSKASNEELQSIMRRYITQLKQIIGDFELKFEKRVRNINVVSNLKDTKNHLAILTKDFVNTGFSILNPFKTLSFQEDIKNKLSDKVTSSFSSIVGSALYKLTVFSSNESKSIYEKINLLPELEKFNQNRKINFLSQFALKSILILIAVLYFGKSSLGINNLLHYNAELVNAPSIVLELQENNNQEISLKKELMLMEQSLKLTNSVNSNKKINFLVLSQIVNSVPSGVRFASLEYDGSDQIEIVGNANTDGDILKLITNLNKQKLIQQASFSLVVLKKNNTNSNAKQFKIICKIKGMA